MASKFQLLSIIEKLVQISQQDVLGNVYAQTKM